MARLQLISSSTQHLGVALTLPATGEPLFSEILKMMALASTYGLEFVAPKQ
jgi:hypothetical protein